MRFRLAWSWLAIVCIAAVSTQALAQSHSAVSPEPRPDEWWQKRQAAVNERIAQGNVDVIFVGDSITQGWEGPGKETWEQYYADRNVANLGFSGDRTQHVLWRLDNGNIAGISPKLAVVMIGTNNHRDNSAEEIADGVSAIVQKLRTELADTKILLLAIFPREETPGEFRAKLNEVNESIAGLDDGEMVHFLDINRFFLEDDGTLPKSIMPDALHPNENGYRIWANAMEPKIAELLGEVEAGEAPIGFVKLFNGEDLTGWKGLVADPEKRAQMSEEELAEAQEAADESMRAHWHVKDGALVFDGGGESLCTARDYGDFEMLVDWKIGPEGDTGIYLRGSPQVQIWDPAQWPQGSGGLFNNKEHPSDPLVKADNPIGEWNSFRIIMVGEKVTVYLNDQLVVDNTVLENYWDRSKPIYESGQIELQNHGNEISFKNIFIREIPRGEGWYSLFDGESLNGWEEVGSEGAWAAEDGLLYTTGEGGGWLSTTQEYDDFELSLEFRVPENGNSGVFIRAPREGNPAFEGSEIQLLDDYGSEYTKLEPWQYTGAVYATIAPSRRWTLPAGTWQKVRIKAEGDKIEVHLNGHEIVNGDLSEHMDKVDDHPGLKRDSGYIGLQNHGTRLDFRNIRIRELGGE
jgi:lysophospholipase L1-like esterase